MKPFIRYSFFLAISGVLLLTACEVNKSTDYNIISFKGAVWAGNLSTSYIAIGTSTISKDNPEVKVVAASGDLLYITCEEGDDAFYFRYDNNDQKTFTVKFTENEIQVNDQIYGFRPGSDSAAWAQFANIDPETVSQLKYMELKGPLTGPQMSALEKTGDSCAGIGLYLTSMDSTEQFAQIISMLKPSWLVLDNSYPGPFNEDLTGSLSDVKLLLAEGKTLVKSHIIDNCPNIEQLIVTDYRKEHALQFTNLTKLKSLSLDESDLPDLSEIPLPPGINRLQFIMSDTVMDISGLKKVRTLSSLSLAGSSITDITFLNNLPPLQFLSLPSNISQEEFNLVIQDHRTLEILEVNGCDSIHDLSVLKDLYRLKALTVNLSDADLTGLNTLTHVNLIVLGDSLWNKQEDVEALKSALPDTDIYPGNGLCLGSGWIFMIIPFLIIIRYRYYLYKRKR